MAGTLLLHQTLPAELRDWHPPREPSTVQIILAVIAGLAVPFGAVGTIGLLRLQRWGAQLYLIALVVGYGVMPFTGPVVATGADGALSGVFAVISGAALALAFFTDALEPKAPPLLGAPGDRRTPPPPGG